MVNIIIIENEIRPGLINKFKAVFSKNQIYQNSKFIGKTQINYVTIKQKKMSIKWNDVKKILNGDTTNIVCEKSLQLPESLGLSQFNTDKFTKKLCLNTAVHIIKNLNIKPELLKISIYDPFLEYHNVIKELIMFARQIKVVTHNVNLYSETVKFLEYEYGVSIPISNKTSWLSPCNILIAPTIDKKIYSLSDTLIFTCNKDISGISGIIFNNYCFDVSPKIKKFIPQKINPQTFVAALCNENTGPTLHHIVADYCISGCKSIHVNSVNKFVHVS